MSIGNGLRRWSFSFGFAGSPLRPRQSRSALRVDTAPGHAHNSFDSDKALGSSIDVPSRTGIEWTRVNGRIVELRSVRIPGSPYCLQTQLKAQNLWNSRDKGTLRSKSFCAIIRRAPAGACLKTGRRFLPVPSMGTKPGATPARRLDLYGSKRRTRCSFVTWK